MKAFLAVLFFVAVGIVGLGFYRGWFSVTSGSADTKSNVTFTVDQDKFQKDRKAASENLKDLGRQANNKVAGPGEIVTDGTMVSLAGDNLTITDKEGKEKRHALAANVKMTCDAKPCEAADLKAGMRVRVTSTNDTSHPATRIEALDSNRDFE